MGDRGRRMQGGTYHCMNFIHDGAFGGFDGTSRSDETNVTFNVTAVGLGDVDFAPGGLLHVFDRFAACRTSAASRLDDGSTSDTYLFR